MENTNLSKLITQKILRLGYIKNGWMKGILNLNQIQIKTIYNNDATTKYNRAIAYGTRS